MPDGNDKKYDVFLSHAHVDAEVVEKLATILEDEHKLKVWLDKWVLVPGEHWQQGMAKGLDEAASCAACIGSKTPKGWFQEEIERALNRQTRDEKFRVIPVILPGGDRSLVDQFLELRTWVEFPSTIDDADAVYGLVCGIKGVPRGRGRGTSHSAPAKQIFTVPLPQNPFFTERAHELADLQTALENTGSFALTGLGGVGKTQTAAEYAHRQREHYQAVLWLRAENSDTLFADLTALARLLKLPEADAQEQQLAVAAALRWLDDNDNWLLILDNVNDLKTVAALTRQARAQRRHVIVTQQAQATGIIAAKKHLPIMPDDTGATLLLRRAELLAPEASLNQANPGDAATARQISAQLGGLPLALDQAGAYIGETKCTVGEYLELLSVSLPELLQRRGELDLNHVSVMATYTASLSELARHNQAAAELLNAAAFLAPDAIPEEIFTAGASEFPEALQQAAANRLHWNDAIAAAFKFSLLERNAADKKISVHRMVQAVAKASMTPEARAQWADRVVNGVDAAFPDIEFSNWGTCDRLLPHAQVCAALIAEYGLSSSGAARLLNQTGIYLKERARYAEAEALCRRSLAIAEKAFGLEHPEVAIRLSNLATLLYSTNRLAEAEPLMQRVVQIFEQAYGPEHPNVGVALNNHAQLLQNTNQLAEAEPLMRRALAIDEKSYGPDHPNVATRLNNLAQLLQVTNRLAEAEPLMRRALAIDEESLGPDHPNVAIRLNNLAQLLQVTNRLAEAEPLMRRALAIDEKSYGPDHPKVAVRLNNLATLMYGTNRTADAEPLMRRALAIDEKSYGPDHPDVAIDLNNLAQLLQATNRLAEAEPFMRRVLVIDEESYGAHHPSVAVDLNNLAQLLQAINRPAEAEPLMRRVVDITFRFKKDTGHQHPNQKKRVSNYGFLLQQMGYSDQQVRANLHELAAQYGLSLDE